jgi:hypothetical protein
MEVYKGGAKYGYCPGKAQWYPYLRKIYDMLVVCCELGKLPYDGAIMDQPRAVIETLSWFSRKYNTLSAATRSGTMGKLEKSPKKNPGGSPNGKGVGSGSGQQRPGIHSRSKR